MKCPLCGRDVEELLGGICSQCASERRAFLAVPDVVAVVRCAHCGRLQRKGIWKRIAGDVGPVVQQAVRDEADLDPQLAEAELDVSVSWEDDKNAVARARLRARFGPHPIEREAETRVRLKRSVCNDCSREYGGYFEAIVQVRAESDRVLEAEADSILTWVRREIDQYRDQDRPGAFLSKTERVRGGFDLYAGSHEIAKLLGHSLAERYGATTTESSKLVGRKDGRDLTRTTLLVRLPGYLPGDFATIDGRLYKVLRRDRRRLALWDFERGEAVQREARRIKALKVVGTPQDEHDAVVVSRFDTALQVLDPVTLKTVDVNVEADLAPTPTVRVFRHEERLHIIPEPAQTGRRGAEATHAEP